MVLVDFTYTAQGHLIFSRIIVRLYEYSITREITLEVNMTLEVNI